MNSSTISISSNNSDRHFQRLDDVKAKTGQGRSKIYQGVKEGTFPAPVKIGERAVAWLATLQLGLCRQGPGRGAGDRGEVRTSGWRTT